MKLTVVCSLALVALLVLVQISGSDGSDGSDQQLSRRKRGFIEDLIDGLVTKFSNTISKIFGLNPDDFETFIRSLGRISKSLAKNILEKFLELKNKHYDFGTQQNIDRVDAMMTTLEEVENTQVEKKSFIEELIDGLVTKFSKTISKIFGLNPDDFETFIRSLAKISKSLAKNIIKKFLDLKDKHFDFGTQQNFDRVDAMMTTLEEVENTQVEKKSFIKELIDGLVTKFSKTISKIFGLNPDDFETFIRSLAKISKSLAKNIIKKFLELKDKHFDFGTQQNFERVDAMMHTLEDVENSEELTSGATTLNWTLGLCVPLLAKLAGLF